MEPTPNPEPARPEDDGHWPAPGAARPSSGPPMPTSPPHAPSGATGSPARPASGAGYVPGSAVGSVPASSAVPQPRRPEDHPPRPGLPLDAAARFPAEPDPGRGGPPPGADAKPGADRAPAPDAPLRADRAPDGPLAGTPLQPGPIPDGGYPNAAYGNGYPYGATLGSPDRRATDGPGAPNGGPAATGHNGAGPQPGGHSANGAPYRQQWGNGGVPGFSVDTQMVPLGTRRGAADVEDRDEERHGDVPRGGDVREERDRADPGAGVPVTGAAAAQPASVSGSAAVPGQARAAVGARRAGDDGPGPRGRRAAAEADEPGGAVPLRPGDVAQTRITIWDDEAIGSYRAEWHELKAQFVDDPVTALTRAHDLLTEAVHELTESLLAERDDLDPRKRTSTPDTESMRVAMNGYREFLDRILTL